MNAGCLVKTEQPFAILRPTPCVSAKSYKSETKRHICQNEHATISYLLFNCIIELSKTAPPF